MSADWNYPGARWWRFDFHTHTPASKDTNAWQAAIGTPHELTPQAWLLKYMEAEIDCVAVTEQDLTGRGAMMDKRGEGVQIILDSSERLSGKRPIFRMVDESELLLVIQAAMPMADSLGE